jgi:signal transduction histidine kinase
VEPEAPESRYSRGPSQEGSGQTGPDSIAQAPRLYDVSLNGDDGGGSPLPTMSDSERLSRLRHDLSNPLSALLAETQLLLLNESQIDPETLTSLREIEALAIRMRTMLRES